MGTRSYTQVVDRSWEGTENNELPIINIYGHSDGYPEWMGKELAKFLQPILVVNGIGMQEGPIANGTGCLAAQLIVELKDGVGGFAMQPTPKTAGLGEDAWDIDYCYIIYVDQRRDEGKQITLECWENTNTTKKNRKGVKIYGGTPDEWLAWLEIRHEERA